MSGPNRDLRNLLFPERQQIVRSDYLADIRETIKPILPWGGVIALVAWVPFLFVDPLLFPARSRELMVLRLALSAAGVLMLIGSRVPVLRDRSLWLANFAIFLLLILTPTISNLVGNDPRYLSGYLLAFVVVALFPVPYAHALAMICFSIVYYFVTARWLDPDLVSPRNYYSLSNVSIAFGITALMLYINERQRMQRWLQKVNLETTRAQLKARNEAMEFDLKLASAVQRNLLPAAFPRGEFVEIDGLFVAMEQVGGDFYEVRDLNATGQAEDRGRIMILIADVSGHGVSAAMVAGMTRMSFLHALDAGQRDPGEILQFINRDLIQTLLDEQFLTAFLGVLETESGQFRFANACHRPVVWAHADGRAEELDAEGMMIGMFPEIELTVREVRLEAESVLLFYTDGIVETKNIGRAEFGVEKLAAFLTQNRTRSATAILETLKRALDEFAPDVPREDDLTMLVLRYRPNPDYARNSP